MTRSAGTVLSLIGILVTVVFGFSDTSPQVEIIRGQIVAYSNVKVCADGNAFWDMVVRIQNPAKKDASEFIRVRFSLPCDEAPNWPRDRASSVQEFRLMRDRNFDAILREFMDCNNEQPPTNCEVPMWRRVPGSEDEKLPFGERLPSYRSKGVPVNQRRLNKSGQIADNRRNERLLGSESSHAVIRR
jgi:hypothetical protein